MSKEMNKLVVIVIVAVTVVNMLQGESCPTWFIQESNGLCKCGIALKNSLECSQELNNTKIISGYCLTFDNGTEHFGHCPYNTNNYFTYTPVPSDVSLLDETMCGPLNRTGLLCSECQPGLGPAVFSYYRECKECLAWPYGWIVYIVRLVVPLTFLCVIVIVFRINIASPPLNTFVVTAQILSSGSSNNPFFLNEYMIGKLIRDFYGIFNLDFFAYTIPTFCINESMNTLSVIMLNYLAALYPILFTVFVYTCIAIHDRGWGCFPTCWKPFHNVLVKFRQRWNLKGSVLNSFSTFLFLSHSKIISTSVHLAQSVQVWDKYGNVTHRMYFDAQHKLEGIYLLYVWLASTISFVVVLLPLIFVLFYQNKFFQKCLTFTRFKSRLIREMATITQSCFKNVTTPGTRDYRWFAGVYMIMRVIIIGTVNLHNISFYYVILFSVIAIMIAGLRPYKNNLYNVMDCMLWLAVAIANNWLNFSNAKAKQMVSLLFLIGPFLVLAFIANWHITVFVFRRCRTHCTAGRAQIDGEGDSYQGDLPHRLLTPSEYTPLK